MSKEKTVSMTLGLPLNEAIKIITDKFLNETYNVMYVETGIDKTYSRLTKVDLDEAKSLDYYRVVKVNLNDTKLILTIVKK